MNSEDVKNGIIVRTGRLHDRTATALADIKAAQNYLANRRGNAEGVIIGPVAYGGHPVRCIMHTDGIVAVYSFAELAPAPK